MNKIERFDAMLQGREVDRVPAGFWYHFPPAFHGGEAMARAHLDYYRSTDLDVLKVMNDTGYAPVGRVRIDRPEDWRALQPTPLSDPLFQSHIDGLKRIAAEVGGEVRIMTTVFNPYNQALAVIRAGRPDAFPTQEAARALFLEHVRNDPEPVAAGMQVIAEDLARFYTACLTQTGIHGLYFSAQGGEREVISDEEHARYIKPYDLVILDAVRGIARFVVGHFCGRAIRLERFSDYPVQVINWAAPSDNLSLRQGRELFGGLPVLGGLDERGPLVYGPRAALRAEVEAAIEAMGRRGFMLGAGCTVPGDVDHRNLIYARSLLAPGALDG